jgi:hypothetical protein
MRKISEYIEHAEECRKMAGTTKNPEQKDALREMAEAWEMLAREREKLLEKRLSRKIA